MKLYQPPSSNPSSPPNYDLTSNYEHSDISDPPSLTLAELQATAYSKKTQFVLQPSKTIPPPAKATSEPSEPLHKLFEPTSQPSEPDLTLPTIDQAFSKFSENSASRLGHLSDESRVSDNHSEVRTHWNGFLRWINYEVFKLKGLSELVRNDYVKGAEERLEARLAQEAAERAKRKDEEKDVAEATSREEAKKVAAEAEAKAKVEAEAAHKVAKDTEKINGVALTQGELSTSDLAPLILNNIEQLQKE